MRVASIVAASLLLVSCQSSRSWSQGCPAPYSGARYFADITPTVPFDGKLFFMLDLLPTLVVDTLALPVTSFSEPERPASGYPVGCRWADGK